MTHAQKEYLLKGAKFFGIFLYCTLIIVFAIAGSETQNWMMWVGLAMLGVPCVFIVFALIYVPVATAVWHWRLMGICEEEWQSDLLAQWWFWMYRSEKWFSYLSAEIYENLTEENQAEKQKQLDFLYALNRVKKPKWL